MAFEFAGKIVQPGQGSGSDRDVQVGRAAVVGAEPAAANGICRAGGGWSPRPELRDRRVVRADIGGGEVCAHVDDRRLRRFWAGGGCAVGAGVRGRRLGGFRVRGRRSPRQIGDSRAVRAETGGGDRAQTGGRAVRAYLDGRRLGGFWAGGGGAGRGYFEVTLSCRF